MKFFTQHDYKQLQQLVDSMPPGKCIWIGYKVREDQTSYNILYGTNLRRIPCPRQHAQGVLFRWNRSQPEQYEVQQLRLQHTKTLTPRQDWSAVFIYTYRWDEEDVKRTKDPILPRSIPPDSDSDHDDAPYVPQDHSMFDPPFPPTGSTPDQPPPDLPQLPQASQDPSQTPPQFPSLPHVPQLPFDPNVLPPIPEASMNDTSSLELQQPPQYNGGPPPDPPSPQGIISQPLRVPQLPHFPSLPELRPHQQPQQTHDESMTPQPQLPPQHSTSSSTSMKPPLAQRQPQTLLPISSTTATPTRRTLPTPAPVQPLSVPTTPKPSEVIIETNDNYKKKELDRSFDEGDAQKHQRLDKDDTAPPLPISSDAPGSSHENATSFDPPATSSDELPDPASAALDNSESSPAPALDDSSATLDYGDRTDQTIEYPDDPNAVHRALSHATPFEGDLAFESAFQESNIFSFLCSRFGDNPFYSETISEQQQAHTMLKSLTPEFRAMWSDAVPDSEPLVEYLIDLSTGEILKVDDETANLTDQELIDYAPAVHLADYKELHQFVERHVFAGIKRSSLPKNSNIVDCVWVRKWQQKPVVVKSRMCARGCFDRQKHLIDRHSSTASRLSQRLVVSMGMVQGLIWGSDVDTESLDISCAFLQGWRYEDLERSCRDCVTKILSVCQDNLDLNRRP